MVTGHYFTMVNNGSVIISTNPDLARVSVDEPCHTPRQWLISRSLREALFREIAPCSFSLSMITLFRSKLCCMACLSGQCDTLNSAAVRALWSWTTHAPNCETQHIRIGLGAEWLPSTHNRCPSQISDPRRLILPSAGPIGNQGDGCCDECKKILGSKTINLTNKTIK